MPFRTRAVPISTTFATRPNEELACFSFEVLSHLIVNLGMDVLVGTAELRERDPRLDREEVGCGLEDIPMLKKGAERHVLRIEVLALRFLLWDEFLLERDGALEQQAQAVLVCQLRNTVKVSGKSFWVPFLRAYKEILQVLRISDGLRSKSARSKSRSCAACRASSSRISTRSTVRRKLIFTNFFRFLP